MVMFHQESALYSKFKLQITWFNKVYKRNICGGSIYSENVIVTAAHCCEAIFIKWDENDFVIGMISHKMSVITIFGHKHYEGPFINYADKHGQMSMEIHKH